MYRSAILVSVARNCCNPYICTRCGENGHSVYCCDENDPTSVFASVLGPHPVQQRHYAEELRRQPL